MDSSSGNQRKKQKNQILLKRGIRPPFLSGQVTDNETHGISIQASALKEKILMPENQKLNVQTYINVFRNEIGKYLQKNIGQQFHIASFPSGVIINIRQQPQIFNFDDFKGKTETISEAFNLLGLNPEDFYKDDDLKKIEANEKVTNDTEVLIGDTVLLVTPNFEKGSAEDRAVSDVKDIVKYISKANNK